MKRTVSKNFSIGERIMNQYNSFPRQHPTLSLIFSTVIPLFALSIFMIVCLYSCDSQTDEDSLDQVDSGVEPVGQNDLGAQTETGEPPVAGQTGGQGSSEAEDGGLGVGWAPFDPAAGSSAQGGVGGTVEQGGTGGMTGQGGAGGTEEQSGTGGTVEQGGTGGEAGTGGTVEPGGTGGEAGTGGTGGEPSGELFSFFVTSLEAMQRLSGSQDGFGGDLRYGEATGLAGADKICTEIAELSMPGAGNKGWRAFLSTTTGGPDGGPVHAIDRIGEGPWYDRVGRVVAMNKEALLNDRPEGADPIIINDLPNEYGIPNQYPGGTPDSYQDNHHMLTGSGTDGRLHTNGLSATCQDWTSAEAGGGRPRCGMSFPRGGRGGWPPPGGGSGSNWISAYDESGCLPGVNIIQNGAGNPGSGIIGSGGGYGGFYCFALTP